jgi:hypothetical protein
MPPATFPAEPVAAAAVSPLVGVRLGFVDGTEVALASGDPRAVALRAVADLLLRGE